VRCHLTENYQSLPLLSLWGGAECTINRVAERYHDQIVLSGHHERPDDLNRFASLGLKAIRYPLLWESFAHAQDPQRLWAWHDARLVRLRDLKIEPILGLIHHGSGPRATNLLAPAFADGLAEHAEKAARRYPWVQDWTPVNEPLTTARFCALYGYWYPHVRDEAAFWLALLNQLDGIRAAMATIRAINPAARLIQTEDLGHTSSTLERAPQAEFDNLRRWASWDMLCGKVTEGHSLWARLAGMGFECRLQKYAREPCPPDILGLNHYLTSDRYLDHRLERYPATTHGRSPIGPLADIEAVRVVEDSPGLEGALRACWDRYGISMAITEVHNGCTREEQMRWLDEAWRTAARLRHEGLQIEAVTVWSLLGAFDWDSLLTREAGHYESGVFDVRSDSPRETALAPMIRTLAAGGVPSHPVLATAGWWRKHARLLAPSIVAGSRPLVGPLLIVGATGTLGQAFAGACRLRGIVHLLTGRETLDLHDPASMGRVLDDLRPWAVINCAGWVRVDDAEKNMADCLAVNCVGNINFAEACSHRDIHYTCFSSDLVFNGELGRPYVESDATAPLNIYGLSKARADDALLAAGSRALIVRTASFFSPFDEHNFAAHLVAALRAEQTFQAVGDCVTSPTYVPDLVRATLDLVIDDEKGLWHLVSDGALSWADFAIEIGSALHLRTELVDVKPVNAMGWAARRPRRAAISSERGLIMPSLASAIERFSVEIEKRDLDRSRRSTQVVEGSDAAVQGQ
jgi:dTDP-4-dehydrorhamnose reductase